MKMTKQDKKTPKKRRDKYESFKLVANAIKNNPEATVEDLEKVLGLKKEDVKTYLKRYKAKKLIDFNRDFTVLTLISEVPESEEKERQLKTVSKALYDWKQSEYLKMYLDGRELVNSTSLRATERVKQNELNYKILKSIDSPGVLLTIKELLGE